MGFELIKYKTLLIFVLLLHFTVKSQTHLIHFTDSAHVLPSYLTSPITTKKSEIDKTIDVYFNKLIQDGYITAKIESKKNEETSSLILINIGKQYQWITLKPGNIDKEILRKSNFKQSFFNNKPISPKALSKTYKKIIKTMENNGYPFASITLDSIVFHETSIEAALLLNKNKLTKIDSIIIKGNAKINPTYLYNYISIFPGDLYNENLINSLYNRLKEIPFISLERNPEVVFFENLTKLTLYNNKKKASKFNGIIGFLPNQTTGDILITGDIELLLNNELGRGEKINLNWRKIQNNVTDLKTCFNYPFILNTPFGTEGTFYLYRRDTTFQDVISKIDFQYILPGANHIGIYYENRTSRLIGTDHLKNSSMFPENLDITKHTYGFSVNKTKLDYRYNPRKGFDMKLNSGIGNRKIIRNPDLNSALYDTLNTSTTQYNIALNVDFFIPVFSTSTINIGLTGARIASSNILNNEQYRIGGFKTLRGFDEESIFASTYSIVTFEYRYILEKNSFARVFIDGSYYENKTTNSFKNDFPFGFGLGLSFDTKAGVFSLDYALGYQQQKLAPIRSAKIHFGFVNYF